MELCVKSDAKISEVIFSEAIRDGADAESPFPLFFAFSASFKNSGRKIVFVLGLVGRVSVSINYCRQI